MYSYIKYKLRNNHFYVRYCQTQVNNLRYFVKHIKLYLRKYHIPIDKEVDGNTVYFIFDSEQRHPGLADRLKVIVCAYWVAKINGFDFRVIFDHSLNFPAYLDENQVKWIGSNEELSYSIRNSRLLAYNGGGKIPKLNKRIKQYHIIYYIGINILARNNIKNWEAIWRQCFNELFVYKDYLIKNYNNTGLVRRKYIAAHLRFVNALEHFEDGHYNSISKEEQQKLINDCLETISGIQNNHKEPLIVFSDSNTFIECAKEAGFEFLQGNIGHVSFKNDAETELKAFLDFYAISQSKKVYRIIKPKMYGTTFSYYAAISGDAILETIN